MTSSGQSNVRGRAMVILPFHQSEGGGLSEQDVKLCYGGLLDSRVNLLPRLI